MYYLLGGTFNCSNTLSEIRVRTINSTFLSQTDILTLSCTIHNNHSKIELTLRTTLYVGREKQNLVNVSN